MLARHRRLNEWLLPINILEEPRKKWIVYNFGTVLVIIISVIVWLSANLLGLVSPGCFAWIDQFKA